MPSVSDNQEIFIGNIVTGSRQDQNLVSEGKIDTILDIMFYIILRMCIGCTEWDNNSPR